MEAVKDIVGFVRRELNRDPLPAAPFGHHPPAGGECRMSAKRRRTYEAGHRPKFLVVIDETPECDRAVYFAARRASARRRRAW